MRAKLRSYLTKHYSVKRPIASFIAELNNLEQGLNETVINFGDKIEDILRLIYYSNVKLFEQYSADQTQATYAELEIKAFENGLREPF